MANEVEVSGFYSSFSPYSLNIDKLYYPNNPHLARPYLAPVRRDDRYVVFSPTTMKTGVVKPEPAFLDDQQRARRLENEERFVSLLMSICLRADHHLLRASREAEYHAISEFEDWCSEYEGSDQEEEEPDEDITIMAPVSSHPVGSLPAFVSASVFYPKPEKKRKEPQQPSPPGPLTSDAATANPSVLFRPPPPWSHLSEHISALLIANASRQVPPSAQPSVLGPSTAGRRAAASDVAGVLAQIGKRRRIDDPPGFGGGGGGASAPATASRNPFRRQSMPGPGLLPASDLHMPVAGPSKPTRMKPRASLPGPVFVSDFAPDTEPSDSSATPAVPSSPPPLGKSILKAAPQPQRPMKPITALPIPILPTPDNKRRVKVRAPRPKSMSQAKLDLQAGFAKPPPVAVPADMEKPVMKLPDAGLTKKRPRVDSAPNLPPVVPKLPAQRKTLKPPNKSLSLKQAPGACGPAAKGKAVSNPKFKDAFNWTGWSKNLS
jgi:hypothetical protein